MTTFHALHAVLGVFVKKAFYRPSCPRCPGRPGHRGLFLREGVRREWTNADAGRMTAHRSRDIFFDRCSGAEPVGKKTEKRAISAIFGIKDREVFYNR